MSEKNHPLRNRMVIEFKTLSTDGKRVVSDQIEITHDLIEAGGLRYLGNGMAQVAVDIARKAGIDVPLQNES